MCPAGHIWLNSWCSWDCHSPSGDGGIWGQRGLQRRWDVTAQVPDLLTLWQGLQALLAWGWKIKHPGREALSVVWNCIIQLELDDLQGPFQSKIFCDTFCAESGAPRGSSLCLDMDVCGKQAYLDTLPVLWLPDITEMWWMDRDSLEKSGRRGTVALPKKRSLQN